MQQWALGCPRPDPAFECESGATLSIQRLISVVDDDQPCRESLRRLLKSLAFRADVFSSAADFLASPRLSETGCLIADIHMPAMTGLELYRHLVASGRTIPTILVTGYPNDADRARALADGVVCYLRKPIDEHDLAQGLRTAFRSDDGA